VFIEELGLECPHSSSQLISSDSLDRKRGDIQVVDRRYAVRKGEKRRMIEFCNVLRSLSVIISELKRNQGEFSAGAAAGTNCPLQDLDFRQAITGV